MPPLELTPTILVPAFLHPDPVRADERPPVTRAPRVGPRDPHTTVDIDPTCHEVPVDGREARTGVGRHVGHHGTARCIHHDQACLVREGVLPADRVDDSGELVHLEASHDRAPARAGGRTQRCRHDAEPSTRAHRRRAPTTPRPSHQFGGSRATTLPPPSGRSFAARSLPETSPRTVYCAPVTRQRSATGPSSGARTPGTSASAATRTLSLTSEATTLAATTTVSPAAMSHQRRVPGNRASPRRAGIGMVESPPTESVVGVGPGAAPAAEATSTRTNS